MSENRPKVGVGALIIKDDSVLLGKRKNAHGEGMWAPPGGHLEFGEEFTDCVLREVAEEVGLTVRNVRFGTVTNNIFSEEQKHYVTIMMLADYAAGEPQVLEPDKCEEWQWFPWKQLPAPLFLPLKQTLGIGFSPFQS